MAKQHGVKHAGHRAWSGGTFLDGLGVVFVLEKICKPAQKVSRMDRGAVEVDEAFDEDAEGGDAAGKDEPHQRAAFLDEFHHKLRSFSGSEAGRQWHSCWGRMEKG